MFGRTYGDKVNVVVIPDIASINIGSDQVDPNESHIRGGEIGKWRKRLSNDDLEEIQKRLARFGLSLDEFDIAHANVEQIVS